VNAWRRLMSVNLDGVFYCLRAEIGPISVQVSSNLSTDGRRFARCASRLRCAILLPCDPGGVSEQEGYLSETNSLLNSRSHRTELATPAHTSQSPSPRPTVPNAGCRNGA
jgi:hypothetical protein